MAPHVIDLVRDRHSRCGGFGFAGQVQVQVQELELELEQELELRLPSKVNGAYPGAVRPRNDAKEVLCMHQAAQPATLRWLRIWLTMAVHRPL